MNSTSNFKPEVNSQAARSALRQYSETHIDEDCTSATGLKQNALFWNCTFKKLKGLVLERCVLRKSTFETDSINDALGFTLTLDCHSFRDVTFSPLLFDLYLLMAIQSSGNDEKRKKLVEVLGKDRVVELFNMIRNRE